MSRYTQLTQKLLGIGFVAAPLLLVVGAVVYLLGIERSVDGTTSWIEGMFMGLAFMLFVPLYLELCRKLGERLPVLATVCSVAVVGIGFGVVPASHRIMQASLTEAGFDQSVWTVATHPGGNPSLIWMALGFLASIALGVGFLRKGGIPRLSAILLILTPIVFIVGQGGDENIAWWQVNIVYPLSAVLWLVAFAPVGWRYLSNAEPNAANRDPQFSSSRVT